jgi:hypothetical protein
MATARRQLGYVSSLTTQTSFVERYGVATGGTSLPITVSGQAYTLLTFTSDDNLVVSQAGLFDVLLVGGGGGGGAGGSGGAAGGGGAGALVGLASTTTLHLTAGTYAVDIGAGGAATLNGDASYVGNIISACGGGYGGNGTAGDLQRKAGSGGCGGGNGRGVVVVFGKSVDETFGNDGGVGDGSTDSSSGGGGGYGAVGGNGATSGTGGAGGNGVDISSWTGAGSADNIAAGGGGGGSSTAGAAGTGGVAGVTTGTGNAATTAGSGGGGTYGSGTTGGAGAAGKVWVRFKV